jgi:hypothetical protein
MRDSMKRLIEESGGSVLMGGTLVQFGEESFDQMFRQIYEAGMDQAARLCHEYGEATGSDEVRNCVALILNAIEQPDMMSDSSGGSHGQH